MIARIALETGKPDRSSIPPSLPFTVPAANAADRASQLVNRSANQSPRAEYAFLSSTFLARSTLFVVIDATPSRVSLLRVNMRRSRGVFLKEPRRDFLDQKISWAVRKNASTCRTPMVKRCASRSSDEIKPRES
jgi:hypothetical protein